jgi:hypothetical protein
MIWGVKDKLWYITNVHNEEIVQLQWHYEHVMFFRLSLEGTKRGSQKFFGTSPEVLTKVYPITPPFIADSELAP